MDKAFLVLENGQCFPARGHGCKKDTIGELVFTNAVCGIAAELTDAVSFGQIMLATFPLTGNCGVGAGELEARGAAVGFVARELCEQPSNFSSLCTADEFLQSKGISAVSGVDTRNIARILTKEGTMNAGIFFGSEPQSLDAIKAYRVTGAVQAMSVKRAYTVPSNGQALYNVAVIDCGCGTRLAQALAQYGCEVKVYPYNVTAGELKAAGYNGVAVSQGGGSPYDCEGIISTLRELGEGMPMLGVGLGHQLMALAAGAQCIKLPYGHRGSNHPVVCSGRNRTYITSQNHGWAVNGDTLKGAAVTMYSADDGTCEGLEYASGRAVSSQFFPELSAGVQNTAFILERFISMMGGGFNA